MNDEHKECCDGKHMNGMGWRVSLSIVGGVGWLVFLVIWLFFYAGLYSWEKNIAIILLSLLLLITFVGFPWLFWWRHHQKPHEKELLETKGFRGRIWFSGLIAVVLFCFLIYWFWYQAEPYTWYQNLAILIVVLLIMGGSMGAAWAPWGMKHEDTFKKNKTQ